MVEEVKLRRKYLNSGDVFILDLGLDLIQVGYSNVWMSIMRESEGAGPATAGAMIVAVQNCYTVAQ